MDACYNLLVDCVLTLDVGSSSVRTLLYSFEGREIAGFGSQVQYEARTTPDGGWEIDAGELIRLVTESLDVVCGQFRAKTMKPAAVAVDTFWHNLLGVDAEGNATTPVLHPFDTRSAAAANRLAERVDNAAQHRRTGCMLHPGYVPAKLLWLRRTAHRWMSIGEYLFLKFFGRPAASTSMISASGLWDQNANDYDEEILAAVGVKREQLARVDELDSTRKGIVPWPELSGIPWFPALGDGACNNVGSGCVTPARFALMVGTSGALRAAVERDRIDIPDGLFCYRIDRKRFVLGGALSNGGEVFAWMKRVLRLPGDNAVIEKQLAELKPFLGGLTILPLFAGERSPGWRADARAAITGLGTNTSPIEILQSTLASVALRFREVYQVMQSSPMLQPKAAPRGIIASGGALLHSRVWTQMMADALGHPVIPCVEPEATSRGAALLALERMGAIRNIGDPQPQLSDPIRPVAANGQIYEMAANRQSQLYKKLFEEDQ